MNRYNDTVRERIENHLHMVLRTDPAGSTGLNVCRVYSPEVNTQEKLRKLLTSLLSSDTDAIEDAQISSSTLQRMINSYLESRKLRIVFKQTDRNACPHCKTLQYAVMEYHHEAKKLEEELNRLLQEAISAVSRPSQQEKIESLRLQVNTKQYQEQESLREIKVHNGRDCFIRSYVKRIGDHFRAVENYYRQTRSFLGPSRGWNSFHDHACITHQDDVSKVDLPYFVESASADITRWQFDVSAHASAVTNGAAVFSHEQGPGPKNVSAIIEEILLEHIISCRGEGIKIIVSDNASVRKNWLCTVPLPQYIVDQGFSDIAVVIFLENNHGKWLADKLFGQLQSRRKRSTLISVDDLLSECEEIRRRSGKVRGFAVNPLSSIDFSEVFYSLGYETKPSKHFGFT